MRRGCLIECRTNRLRKLPYSTASTPFDRRSSRPRSTVPRFFTTTTCCRPCFRSSSTISKRLGGARPLLAVVDGSVVREQDLRTDLSQPVQNSADAVVGADSGPYGTERCRSQHGHQGLDMVGDVAGDDAVLPNSCPFHGIGAASDLLPELCPCRLPPIPFSLRDRNHRGPIAIDLDIRREEQILGKS